MKIGAMNHPDRSLAAEIGWMAEMKLDFIDLTLEPPAAASWQVKPAEVAKMLKDHGLGVVGHTAYYLPLGSSFESVRRAALEELKHALEIFAAIGARWMNVHPDRHAPFVDQPTVVARNIDSLRQLVELARPLRLGVMLENVPGWFNSAAQLGPMLEAVPELGLHLDVGHCNLDVEKNTADELLRLYSSRLAHVHLHDNRGGHADLHLPLGLGSIDIPHYVRLLKTCGYDDTITLEVFANDRHYLEYSCERLREWWNRG